MTSFSLRIPTLICFLGFGRLSLLKFAEKVYPMVKVSTRNVKSSTINLKIEGYPYIPNFSVVSNDRKLELIFKCSSDPALQLN
jgi:hypothetical protein